MKNLATVVDTLEQLNRAVAVLETLRERLVTVLGHTCQNDNQESGNGDST